MVKLPEIDGMEIFMKTHACFNEFTKNLNRIEFMVTLACTGKCKHCSEGTHSSHGSCIRCDAAVDVVRRLADQYNIESLMTFGGEPLLYWETVCEIQAAAREAGIQKRQLITNGYFTKQMNQMHAAAQALSRSGITDILLSVDAFHQETIPLGAVKEFAGALLAEGVNLRTQPAWLVSSEAENDYNEKTREILKEFEAMGIEAAEGNTIFPSGNALVYLKDFFDEGEEVINPYIEDPMDVRAICIGPDGDVLGGNIYKTDILEILKQYEPRAEGD